MCHDLGTECQRRSRRAHSQSAGVWNARTSTAGKEDGTDCVYVCVCVSCGVCVCAHVYVQWAISRVFQVNKYIICVHPFSLVFMTQSCCVTHSCMTCMCDLCRVNSSTAVKSKFANTDTDTDADTHTHTHVHCDTHTDCHTALGSNLYSKKKWGVCV